MHLDAALLIHCQSYLFKASNDIDIDCNFMSHIAADPMQDLLCADRSSYYGNSIKVLLFGTEWHSIQDGFYSHIGFVMLLFRIR